MNAPIRPTPVDFRLRGQAEGCGRGNISGHIFGSLFSDVGSVQSLRPYGATPMKREDCGSRRGTFLVSTTHTTALRRSADPVAPLSDSDVLGPLPAGASRANLCPLKAIIDCEMDSGPRRFLMDWGESIEVQAASVRVVMLAPLDSVLVLGVPPAAPQSGVVFDTLAGVAITAIEAPIGKTSAKFSEVQLVPAGVATALEVAPCAQSVIITQTSVGTAIASFDMMLGGLQIGQLPMLASRVSQPGSTPREADFLRVATVDAVNDRSVLLVWEVSP